MDYVLSVTVSPALSLVPRKYWDDPSVGFEFSLFNVSVFLIYVSILKF